jgi:hypothetical protein
MIDVLLTQQTNQTFKTQIMVAVFVYIAKTVITLAVSLF